MKTALTLILALAGLSIASAQSPGGGVFQKFDKNSDGKVTVDELPNQQAFDRFDTNKDGAIMLEEYNAVSGGTNPPTRKPANPPVTPMKPGETSPGAATPTVPADAVFPDYAILSDSKRATGERP